LPYFALEAESEKMKLSLVPNEPIVMVAGLLVLLAVYSDIRWRKIPNCLTLPAIALGFFSNFLGNSWNGLVFAFLGLLLGTGLLVLPYLFGGMGGGDVKLMGALGAMLGSYAVLNIFLYTTLAGGAIGIVVAIANKSFVVILKKVWVLLKCIFLLRAPLAGAGLFKTSMAIPYGLAIGLGTFLYLFVGKMV
jgi:prepilin peptidase CpaA